MPLTMLSMGKESVVSHCNSKGATKKFLEGLGILPGTPISVICDMGGNLIVNVKGSRIAINKGIAQKLMVNDI